MSDNKRGILSGLNPADYFTLAMDDEIRREGMAGSLCGFALQLNSLPNINELTVRINEFVERFPLATASLQQRGKRFYWCQRDVQPNLFFEHYCLEDINGEIFQQQTIEQCLNHLEARHQVLPIEFHLISGNGQVAFLMRWIHPFCDVRGADLILKYLCCDVLEQRALFDLPVTEPLVDLQLQKMSLWRKFRYFLQAKQHIKNLDRYQSILPYQVTTKPESLSYKSQRLTVEQTTIIAKQARKQVGMMGTSLYYMGCVMRALTRLEPEAQGEAFCVPYAFNLRRQKVLSPLLGNHVGALFAQAHKDIVNDRIALFQHLKQQNKQQIQQGLDKAFLPIMWAASWLSLEKHGKNLRQSYVSGEERSSFWFSDIGQPDIAGLNFCDANITGLLHLCQLSSPPALAVLSCQYQQRLTLTYNFMRPLMDDVWIEKLQALMLEELLGESS